MRLTSLMWHKDHIIQRIYSGVKFSKIDIGMEMAVRLITRHYRATVVSIIDWFHPKKAMRKRNKGQENMLPSQL